MRRTLRMTKLVLTGLFLTALLGTSSRSSEGAPPYSNWTVKHILESVVDILMDGRSVGTGVFVGDQGYLVTASHILDQRHERLELVSDLYDRKPLQLIAVDRGHDLALLRMTGALKPKMRRIIIAKKPAETTSTLHNFGGTTRMGLMVLPGFMARHWTYYAANANTGAHMACVCVAGSPTVTKPGSIWLDEAGHLTGIHCARLLSDQGTSSSVSLAAPPSAISTLLKNKRDAQTPALGGEVLVLRDASAKWTKHYGPTAEGLIVTGVHKGGELAKAGVKINDLIVHCNGKDLDHRSDLFEAIRRDPPPQSVTLHVRSHKDGTSRKAVVKLEVLERAWRSQYGK